MQRAYPTRNGMPVPTSELDLSPTRLRVRPENQSVHHLHYEARDYGRLLIAQTLRDLETEQEIMQNDQHNIGKFALHTLFSPPELPTPRQMMDRLEVAKVQGSQLNIRHKGLGYVKEPFTEERWQQIHREYNRLGG